jgi:hypothetical protein
LLNWLEKELEEDGHRLAAAKTAKIDPRARGTVIGGRGRTTTLTFTSEESRAEFIRRTEANVANRRERIASLRAVDGMAYPDLPLPPNVGDLGLVRTQRAIARQVIGDTEALIEIDWPIPGATDLSGRPAWSQVTLLVRGVSTKGIADGRELALPQVFEVTGTHRYTTVGGGTKTVLVIQPVDERQLKVNLGKYFALRRQKHEAAATEEARRQEAKAKAEAEARARAEVEEARKAKAAAESTAAFRLRAAKELLAEGKRDRAVEALNRLIKEYPDTKAGQESKKLLADLK